MQSIVPFAIIRSISTLPFSNHLEFLSLLFQSKSTMYISLLLFSYVAKLMLSFLIFHFQRHLHQLYYLHHSWLFDSSLDKRQETSMESSHFSHASLVISFSHLDKSQYFYFACFLPLIQGFHLSKRNETQDLIMISFRSSLEKMKHSLPYCST